MADGPDVKSTLNLPQTPFAMKAKLSLKEPELLQRWEQIGLYDKIQAARAASPSFVLHDGPPYANGNIHLGTAMNKILKDFIIKSKTMQGFRAPYLPGWDCHGLPIEIHVDKLLGDKKKELSLIQIREECRAYALKYLDIQRSSFKRLGILGEWDKPYMTMDPAFEAEVIRHLAAFFASGNVFKGKRAVHWCPVCKTALAEAEIVYKDKTSPSIYVKFPVVSDLSDISPALAGRKISVIIWTTTPWTLPANLAIAFHPEHDYAAWESGGDVYITAHRLMPMVAEICGLKDPRVLAVFPGRVLEKRKARHPFIDRDSLFVLAEYVSLEDGTGAVHTAPGHGHDDFLTGVAYGLDPYAPLDDEGRFLPEVEKYAGLNVFKANRIINEDMKKDGSLLHENEISHSYPHCWRCKSPVIFRATAQWFISMDAAGLRTKALEAIKRVRWVPAWGEERMASMMAGRPDWCISRQRSWGVPIPAFDCRQCGHVLADEAIALRVADLFQAGGSNVWFEKTAAELLPPGTVCPQCGSSDLEKESNILDVWFESGASQNVLGKRPDLPWPADVYIEGHDQHRGWFNSSMVIGVGAKGSSPYRACITCGFVLDAKGRAMSKSAGNVIEPKEIIARGGAEILRLWVAMLNYKEDAPYGVEIEARIVEAYRKIRNTWRFLLGNLSDFSPDTDAVPAAEMEPLDRWALRRFTEVGRRMRKGYADYEFHVVYHALAQFFTVDLSAFYLDVLKDRLYCSAKSSRLRRSAQTALYRILRDSLTLMAPILPFTAEEAWDVLPPRVGREESVHLALFPDLKEEWMDDVEAAEWEELLTVRETVLKVLENARERKEIGTSLEARVRLGVQPAQAGLIERYRDQLASLFIVSDVAVEPAAGDALEAAVSPVPGGKCLRCWTYSEYVGTSPDHPEFCRRCDDVVSGRAR
ncbi:MAG: isoleucine--tRNA ligase [Candidatus Aminicenantes bacterium]|nr:isoleucine--tRNA ligase [Candidatus Aminicenantes bacterium]